MSDSSSIQPAMYITADGDIHGVDTPENRELVRRVRACVNACEGITTVDLEAGVINQMVQVMQDVQPLLDDLNKQNAESRLDKAS